MADLLAKLRLMLIGLTLLASLAAVAILGFAPQIIWNDIGWHLAQGTWMIRHGALPYQDVWNYGNAGAPIVSEYPLYQLLLWAVWQMGGETGLAVLASLLLVLTYALYYHAAWRAPTAPWALFTSAIAITGLVSWSRLTVRPEIVTSLGLVFFVTFLMRQREMKSWRASWPLWVAMIVWVNCHSGFILGLALVWGFGAEMVFRRYLATRAVDRGLLRTWVIIVAVTSAATLVNPYGFRRLLLPFYQQGSAMMRIYSSEMHPMAFDPGDLIVQAMLAGMVVLVLTQICYRGRVSWSINALTIAFFALTFANARHVGVYAVLLPGAVLSAGFFGAPAAWVERGFARAAGVAALVLALLLSGMLMLVAISSSKARWNSLAKNEVEYPMTGTDWMRAHGVQGRVLHRGELGGWLQFAGFADGLTYADTGFGKFSEDLIREIGLSADRPGYVPYLISKYRPDIIAVGSAGYEWGRPLTALGWRRVQDDIDGAIWLRPGFRDDLPAMTSDEVRKRYLDRVQKQGLAGGSFFMRRLMALRFAGAPDFVFEQLMAMDPQYPGLGAYWDAWDAFFFRETGVTRPDLLERVFVLANQPENLEASATFRARYHLLHGHYKEAAAALGVTINDGLATIPEGLGPAQRTLLAEILIGLGHNVEALDLLTPGRSFKPSDGRRHELMALLYQERGNLDKASMHWREALFFQPDDLRIRAEAEAFLGTHDDPNLSSALAALPPASAMLPTPAGAVIAPKLPIGGALKQP